MRKFINPFLFLSVVFAILGVGVFSWRYQKLVDRGSEMADEHCLKVNPLIIERKNRSRDFMQALFDPSASPSAQKINELMGKYASANAEYIKGENAWLVKQKEFLSNPEFQILTPSVVRRAAELQVMMFEADRDGSVALQGMTVPTGENAETPEDMGSKVAEAKEREIKYSEEYSQIFKDNKNNNDLRLILFRPPPSKCPASNFDFPNIFDFPAKPVGSPKSGWPLG